VIDPKNRIDAKQDVFISAGKIVALGKAPAGFRAERTIDAANLVVCRPDRPLGAVARTGLRIQGDARIGNASPVAGGVTSLACPPDTDPPPR